MEREAFLQRTAQAKTPLHPTAEMFRDIRCFDFCVEIGEQKKGYYGCFLPCNTLLLDLRALSRLS